MVEYKCKIESPEHSRQVIKAWFEMGYKLPIMCNFNEFVQKKATYLCTHKDGKIYYGMTLTGYYTNPGIEFNLKKSIILW